MSAGFTPGPWAVDPLELGTVGDVCTVAGEPVAQAQQRKPLLAGGDHEREANAHLIAAAPDLLEALKASVAAQRATDDAVEHLERACAEGWADDPSGSGWVTESNRLADAAWDRALKLRDAAIAKAEGK